MSRHCEQLDGHQHVAHLPFFPPAHTHAHTHAFSGAPLQWTIVRTTVCLPLPNTFQLAIPNTFEHYLLPAR